MRRQLVAVGAILAIAAGSVGFYLAQTGTVTTSIQLAPGAPASGNFATMTSVAGTVTGLTGLGAAVSGGFPLARFTTSYSNVRTLKVTVFWLNPNSATDSLKLGYLSVGAYQVVHGGTCVTSPKKTATAPDVTLTTAGATYCAVQVGASGPELTSSGRLILSRTILGGYLVASGAKATAPIPSCSTRALSTYKTDQTNKSPCRPTSITNANTAAVYICAVAVNHGGNVPGTTTTTVSPLQFTMIGSKE